MPRLERLDMLLAFPAFMLQSIDTLIAFVVIMTVASLFVTILVQMCSAALSLRGKNLANALALTFQTIAPALQGKAHRLAAVILSDPFLSDSTRTTKNKLSEIVGSVSDRVEPWHFRNIREAARLASAVRPEEVFAALNRLAAKGDADAEKILEALKIPEAETRKIREQLGPFLAVAEEISDPVVRQKLVEAIEGTPANLLVKANAAQVKFDAWFAGAQDRAQQWFQLHTRGLTIAASFLVALVLQLDAVEIFHRVNVSPAMRNALVAASTSLVPQTVPENRQALLDDLETRIEATGFDFVPRDFWRWPAEKYSGHVFGMILCAGLLTLGAPYWYNLLKNLTSLRPALARAIGQEEAVRKEKPPNE